MENDTDGLPQFRAHESMDSSQGDMDDNGVQEGVETPTVIVEDTDEQEGNVFRRKSAIKRKSAPPAIRTKDDGEGAAEIDSDDGGLSDMESYEDMLEKQLEDMPAMIRSEHPDPQLPKRRSSPARINRSDRPMTMFINNNDDLVQAYELLNKRDLEKVSEMESNGEVGERRGSLKESHREWKERRSSLKESDRGRLPNNDKAVPAKEVVKKSDSVSNVSLRPKSNLTRNGDNRRSLTSFFSSGSKKNKRNSSGKNSKKASKESLDRDDTPSPAFTRSKTSLSLKGDKQSENDKNKRVSLEDLSYIGFGSLSSSQSVSGLTDLQEESYNPDNVIPPPSPTPSTKKLGFPVGDRPWFDLEKFWKDHTKDLPVEDMLKKRKGDTIHGSIDSPEIEPPSSPMMSPSAMKKTVTLLGPDLLINWKENRKKNEHEPKELTAKEIEKDQTSPSPVTKRTKEVKFKDNPSEKLDNRKSMPTLEGMLTGENRPVKDRQNVKRSESARLSKDQKQKALHNLCSKYSDPNIYPQKQNSTSTLEDESLDLHQAVSTNSLNSLSMCDTISWGSSSGLASLSHPASETSSIAAVSNAEFDSDLEVENDPPNWRQQMSKEKLKKLKSKEQKRQDVINELFHTERSHVRNLKVLDIIFKQPLKDSGLITPSLLRKLFPNLEDVIQVHQRYNNAMKDALKDGYPVQNIGKLLTNMFLGQQGLQLVTIGADFTRNQKSALEELKRAKNRNTKLEKFLEECEKNPACKRLQLESLIPAEHQRLMKYPLLLQQIGKYTDQNEDRQECEDIKVATNKTREMLDNIDKQVAEAQNRQRLEEIQKKLDISGLEKLGSEHPVYQEYRNLNLNRHKLLHDGPLTIKLDDTKKVKNVHVLLLDDCIILVKKIDEKYVLKVGLGANAKRMSPEDDSRRSSHSPIIKLNSVLVRPVATDKRAFYLLNTTTDGAQIYELITSSSQERSQWIKHIQEAYNAYNLNQDSHYPGSQSSKMPDGLLSRSANKKGSTLVRKTQSFREPLKDADKVREAARSNSFNGRSKNESEESNDWNNSSQSIDSGESTESIRKTSMDSNKTDAEDDDKDAQPQNDSFENMKNIKTQRIEIKRTSEPDPLIDPSEVLIMNHKVEVAETVISPIEKVRLKDLEVAKMLEEKQSLIASILHIPQGESNIGRNEHQPSRHNGQKDATKILLSALAQTETLSNLISHGKAGDENMCESATSSVMDSDVKGVNNNSEKFAKTDPSTPLQSGNTIVPLTIYLNQHITDLLELMQQKDDEADQLRRDLAEYEQQVLCLTQSMQRKIPYSPDIINTNMQDVSTRGIYDPVSNLSNSAGLSNCFNPSDSASLKTNISAPPSVDNNCLYIENTTTESSTDPVDLEINTTSKSTDTSQNNSTISPPKLNDSVSTDSSNSSKLEDMDSSKDSNFQSVNSLSGDIVHEASEPSTSDSENNILVELFSENLNVLPINSKETLEESHLEPQSADIQHSSPDAIAVKNTHHPTLQPHPYSTSPRLWESYIDPHSNTPSPISLASPSDDQSLDSPSPTSQLSSRLPKLLLPATNLSRTVFYDTAPYTPSYLPDGTPIDPDSGIWASSRAPVDWESSLTSLPNLSSFNDVQPVSLSSLISLPVKSDVPDNGEPGDYSQLDDVNNNEDDGGVNEDNNNETVVAPVPGSCRTS